MRKALALGVTLAGLAAGILGMSPSSAQPLPYAAVQEHTYANVRLTVDGKPLCNAVYVSDGEGVVGVTNLHCMKAVDEEYMGSLEAVVLDPFVPRVLGPVEYMGSMDGYDLAFISVPSEYIVPYPVSQKLSEEVFVYTIRSDFSGTWKSNYLTGVCGIDPSPYDENFPAVYELCQAEAPDKNIINGDSGGMVAFHEEGKVYVAALASGVGKKEHNNHLFLITESSWFDDILDLYFRLGS